MPRFTDPRSGNLDVEKYRSDALLNPKSRKLKEKYFEIYYTYIANFLTERQVSQMYNLSIEHVSRIIKWVVHETDRGDNTEYVREMVDRVSFQLQQLVAEMENAENFSQRMQVRMETRRTLKLLAQIQKVLTSDINIQDNRKVIQVDASGLDRRTGAKTIEGSEVVRPETLLSDK